MSLDKRASLGGRPFFFGAKESGGADPYLRRSDIPLLLMSIIGFGISIYALALHIKSGNGAVALDCDVDDVFSCSNVLAGDYGAFLGVPLGGYGMAYFAILAACAFLPLMSSASAAWHARLRLLISAVGAVVSIGLALLSALVIESVCLVCSAVHVTAVVACLYSFVRFLKLKAEPSRSDGMAAMKFVSAALAVSVPALLAALIAPMVAPKILSAVGGESPEKNLGAEAVSETLLSVAKSRFVGAGEDFRKGNEQAKVVVQMFSDFQCPHCKIAAESIEQAAEKVGWDKVLFVYRNYPLSNACNAKMGSTGHAKACLLAEAARCAGQQGKFWEMKSWAFGLLGLEDSDLSAMTSPDKIKDQATSIGLNGESFQACLDSDAEMAKIRDDIRVAEGLGIKGTPLVVINNRVYTGARGVDDLAVLFNRLHSEP